MAAEVRVVCLPDGKNHTVTVEHGTEKLSPAISEVAAHQIDATYRGDNISSPAQQIEQQNAQRSAERIHTDAPTEIKMPSNEPAAARVVTVGNVQLFPNPLLGTYEAQFTRGGTAPYVAMRGDERLTGDAALEAIYVALQEQQHKAKK